MLKEILEALAEEVGEDVVNNGLGKYMKGTSDIPMKKPFWEKDKDDDIVDDKETGNSKQYKGMKEKSPSKDPIKNKKWDNSAPKLSSEDYKEDSAFKDYKESSSFLEEEKVHYGNDISKLMGDELQRAIVMSEIIGKPRSKRPLRRRRF